MGKTTDSDQLGPTGQAGDGGHEALFRSRTTGQPGLQVNLTPLITSTLGDSIPLDSQGSHDLMLTPKSF